MNKPAIVKEAFTPEAAPPKVPRFNEPYSATSTGASNGAIDARIDPAITTALLRASVDRRIGGQTPFTPSRHHRRGTFHLAQKERLSELNARFYPNQ
jgi:hypothetical protein